ncbi:MAG: hypothetical protein E6G97_07360 [Alphaproteobacteria bacterium]|nr:MAG: hypothetical protein E6G97_07360 [Alphaproteobacteria bacterium]
MRLVVFRVTTFETLAVALSTIALRSERAPKMSPTTIGGRGSGWGATTTGMRLLVTTFETTADSPESPDSPDSAVPFDAETPKL